MKITFQPIKNISEILNEFFSKYQVSEEVSPYQYKEWQDVVYKDYKRNLLYSSIIKAEICIYEKEETAAIFIYQYKYFDKNSEIMLFGSGGMTDYLNLIYTDSFSYDDFMHMIRAVSNRLNRKRYYFNLIQSKTKIYEYITRLSVTKDNINPCIEISIPNTYDEFYMNLSKSTRQNLRTSMNRLEREKKIHNFCILKNTEISNELKKKLINIYLERYKIKNKNVKESFLQNIKKVLLGKNKNIINEAIGTIEDAFVAIEYIDNEPAAYAFILENQNKTSVCIPRVATAEKFYFYSPGMLLFADLIKNICDRNDFVKLWKCIDLTNGNEPYKKKLGGIESNPTHRIHFNINE